MKTEAIDTPRKEPGYDKAFADGFELGWKMALKEMNKSMAELEKRIAAMDASALLMERR